MHITKLITALKAAELVIATHGPQEGHISHLAHNSRQIGDHGLFVAQRGWATDGHLFIDKAVQQGAIAVVCEVIPAARAQRAGITFVHVTDARRALAELARVFYNDPARPLALIGITGTNGKTTTAFLTQHLLAQCGHKTGLIGTVVWDTGGRSEEAANTTPDILQIYQLFKEMRDNGCTACVMEVSSHALDQHRVTGLAFDVALFTNLTHDHLAYHGSFAAYLAAKKKLFDALPSTATALINADDPAGPDLVADTVARIQTYGQKNTAHYPFEINANEITGLTLTLGNVTQTYALVGGFNAYNLTAAYGIGRALGLPKAKLLTGLASAEPIPGRFEVIRGQAVTVIVDYAHTPDALENVLQTSALTKPEAAALWCVFGCGGDRDPSKRAEMGRLAERYADQVVVTSDNPRTEDPEAILADIRTGFNHPETALWEVDRRRGIERAIHGARPGDVVLIAGKGHETYQVIGTEKRPFDDRAEARAALDSRPKS